MDRLCAGVNRDSLSEMAFAMELEIKGAGTLPSCLCPAVSKW